MPARICWSVGVATPAPGVATPEAEAAPLGESVLGATLGVGAEVAVGEPPAVAVLGLGDKVDGLIAGVPEPQADKLAAAVAAPTATANGRATAGGTESAATATASAARGQPRFPSLAFATPAKMRVRPPQHFI